MKQVKTLEHNKSQQQFRLPLGDTGEFGIIDYTNRGGVYYLDHSEVPYSLRGKGYGKDLVEAVFEYLEENKIQSVARCSYIRAVRDRSPRWNKVIG